MKVAFHTLAYWAPMLIILLAVGARAAAPFPYDGIVATQAVGQSLVTVSRGLADKGSLFLKVDGRDPTAALLTDLSHHDLPPTFTPWSARSAANDHCQALAGAPVIGACMQDNFLSADLLSMPLWHVALVRVSTAACTAELALVLGADQWHVLSQRTVCT